MNKKNMTPNNSATNVFIISAMEESWTSNDIPNLNQKVAIVTDANIGLGYEIAKRLAEKNAHVIMACRTKIKADTARAQILQEFLSAKVTVMQVDVFL